MMRCLEANVTVYDLINKKNLYYFRTKVYDMMRAIRYGRNFIVEDYMNELLGMIDAYEDLGVIAGADHREISQYIIYLPRRYQKFIRK